MAVLFIKTKKRQQPFSDYYRQNTYSFLIFGNFNIDGAYKHWKRQKEELEECAKIANDAHIDTNIIYSAIRIFDTLGEDYEK